MVSFLADRTWMALTYAHSQTRGSLVNGVDVLCVCVAVRWRMYQNTLTLPFFLLEQEKQQRNELYYSYTWFFMSVSSSVHLLERSTHPSSHNAQPPDHLHVTLRKQARSFLVFWVARVLLGLSTLNIVWLTRLVVIVRLF